MGVDNMFRVKMKEFIKNKKKYFYSSNIFLLYILIICCIIASEIYCRILGVTDFKSDSSINRYQSPESYFVLYDREIGYINRPNGFFIYDKLHDKPIVTTDTYGFRNGNGWNNLHNGPIILLIGDSYVFGAEVNDNETLSSHLFNLFQSKGEKIRVLNAGVRGYNTIQCNQMVSRCIHLFPKKIFAVINLYCINDVSGNINNQLYKDIMNTPPQLIYLAEL